MKRITLIILTVIFAAAAGGSLAAFDVGGSLTSGTNYSSAAAGGIAEEASVGLWLESGQGEHYSFEMKANLIASISDSGFNFFINPEYLKLNSLYDNLDYGPSILATSVGRFKTSDFSTKIFAQKLDGTIWNFNYPALELTIAAGTTAFMFSDTGSILTTTPSTILSKTDAKQKSDAVTLLDYISDPSSGSLFDSPRAVEIVTLTMPQLLFGQSLNLSFVAQEDMRPMLSTINGYSGTADTYPLINEGETEFIADRGGAFDTQYLGAGISGSIIPSLYHNIYYYFGTGRTLSYVADPKSDTGSSYQYEMILSHMVGASIDYFMPWLFNSRASIGATFGTGDADAEGIFEGNRAGTYDQFTPITGGGGGLIFSPGLSNILSASASFSLKPIEWIPIPLVNTLQVAATAMPFFRVVNGPIAVSGVSDDFTGNYLGSEIDLTVNLRPMSDLGAYLQAGYFLPNPEAFAGSAMAQPTFKAKLNVSLSF